MPGGLRKPKLGATNAFSALSFPVHDRARGCVDTGTGVGFSVSVQKMLWGDAGAWTGEISPPILIDCGTNIVELGHSERRAHFGETDEAVGPKAAAAVRHGLIPLICIGETFEEREAGRAQSVLEQQTRAALEEFTLDQKTAPILLAYEPVWAISHGGSPAKADYANGRHAEIIAVAEDVLGQRLRCLYGGSVNPGNCAELIGSANIDGLSIGCSTWDIEGYLNILAHRAAVILQPNRRPNEICRCRQQRRPGAG